MLIENKSYPKKPKPNNNNNNNNNNINNSNARKKVDYYDTKRTVSDKYVKQATCVLCNKFSLIHKNFIQKVMQKFNNHYLPALRSLEDVSTTPGLTKMKRPRD